jgi:hypothetical protein
MRNVYRLFVRKPQRKRALGRPRRRWVDNVKMDGVVWTELVWLMMGRSGELVDTR